MKVLTNSVGNIKTMLLSLKYESTFITIGRNIAPIDNADGKEVIAVVDSSQLEIPEIAALHNGQEGQLDSLIGRLRAEGVNLKHIEVVNEESLRLYEADYCSVQINTDEDRWIQDEIQYVEERASGNIIHASRDKIEITLSSCYSLNNYNIASSDSKVAGGDVLILEDFVLIGGKSFQRQPEWVNSPAKFAGKTAIPINSKYAWKMDHKFKSKSSPLTKKMSDGEIAQPLYHLDLYLNALEDENRIVFFLGYLIFGEKYKTPRSRYVHTEYVHINKSLNGLVKTLLEIKTHKAVSIRRVPILVGKNHRRETYSFTNGFMENQNGVANFYVAVPKPNNYSITQRDIDLTKQKVIEAYEAEGINVNFISVDKEICNSQNGGLHCRGKVIEKSYN